jgi:hypothetical protein
LKWRKQKRGKKNNPKCLTTTQPNPLHSWVIQKKEREGKKKKAR